MNLLELIFGKKRAKENRYGRFEEAEFSKLKDSLVKKVGKLEGDKILKSARINELGKKLNERDKKILEMSREKVVYSPFVKRNSLSIYELMNFSRKKKEIKVLTKDHRYIGRLWDIRISVMGNMYFFDILTELDEGGKKVVKTIMRHPELSECFHNAVGFVDAIKNGVLILNRMMDGHFVPDLYTDDGKGVDEVIGMQHEQIDELSGIASKAKEREEDERQRRKIEKLGHDSRKKFADTASAALVETAEKMQEMQMLIGRDKIEKNELHTKLDIMKNDIEVSDAAMIKMKNMVKEVVSKDEYERFSSQMDDQRDKFTKQLRELVEVLKDRPDPKPAEKSIAQPQPATKKTPHPLNKLVGRKK